MAQTITISAKTLASKSNELKILNNSFKKQISELRASERALNSMWDGGANDAFHRAFEKDTMQMDYFYNAIEKYAISLFEAAKAYEKAERVNLHIARQRKY